MGPAATGLDQKSNIELPEKDFSLVSWSPRLISVNVSSSSSYFICRKRRRATRKAEAHHTLVAHYMTIVNVRIKHTTHTSTYKHSKQVYHSTHYTLTHTQTQNNHLKCRPKSTLLVTVLQQLCYGHEYCCDCFFWSKDISLGSRYE